MDRLNILITSLALLTCSSSIASFIDHDNYVTDTSSGLDWLDISSTVGYSALSIYERTLSGGSLEGWRVAGYSEVFDLASQFDGQDAPYLSPGNYDDSSYSDSNNHNGVGNGELGLSDFIDIFGATRSRSSSNSLSVWFGVEENDVPLCGVSEPCGFIGKIGFYNYLDPTKIDYIITDTGASPADTLIPSMGTFVIRNSISVPEPPFITLLFVGLIGLGITRRKARNQGITWI